MTRNPKSIQNDCERPQEIAEMSPATYHQYVSLLLERLASESLPELAGMIRLRGRMTDPGAAKGSQFYGVKIVDDGGAQVKADIPVSLVQGRGAHAGQQVVLTGRPNIRSNQYGVEARLTVTDLQLGDKEEPAVSAVPDQGNMTLERLRTLPVTRHPFPFRKTITVAVIQSASAQAQVSQDCLAELNKLPDILLVNPVPVNMLDPVAIANAVRSADADILMLIRGGGDSRDFEVFESARVVQAVAECPAYRVIGLGHTGNRSLLELVVEHASRTPAQAGGFVREKIELRFRSEREYQRSWAAAKDRIEALETELNKVNTRLHNSSRYAPFWVLAAAIGGALLVWFVAYR